MFSYFLYFLFFFHFFLSSAVKKLLRNQLRHALARTKNKTNRKKKKKIFFEKKFVHKSTELKHITETQNCTNTQTHVKSRGSLIDVSWCGRQALTTPSRLQDSPFSEICFMFFFVVVVDGGDDGICWCLLHCVSIYPAKRMAKRTNKKRTQTTKETKDYEHKR